MDSGKTKDKATNLSLMKRKTEVYVQEKTAFMYMRSDQRSEIWTRSKRVKNHKRKLTHASGR